MSRRRDMDLLAGAGMRVAAAAVAASLMWLVVFWASQPARAPDGQAFGLALPNTRADTAPALAPDSGAAIKLSAAAVLRAVVAVGQSGPEGGTFDRFDVNTQPVVAPVNARGQVAFYAKMRRAKQGEGIFLAAGSGVTKIAAIGDPVPGGGRLSEFARHPVPSLNAAGKVAFGAGVTGGTATDGVFLASNGALKVIALTGAAAPGVPNGTFLDFDTPVLNDNDEIAFVASVRRGRETIQALYLHRGGKLVKLVASGEPSPKGGTFEGFGVPAMNQKGVIGFAATIERGPVLGGIFVAGTRDLTLLVGAGQTVADGGMLVRFSERLAIDDDDNVAFGAHLNVNGSEGEAVFVANVSGLTRVVAVGDAAPGGGRFAAFGAWPAVGPSAAVVFVAAVDTGPAPAGVFVWRKGAVERVALVGDKLEGGGKLASLAINPAPSAGANGGVTFATMAAPEEGKSAIYYFGPPPLE